MLKTMPGPTGKSLTLDLLSTLRGGSMPIAALVAAGEVFGLGEGSVRVAVTRLVAGGQVERDERGRYRLGPASAPVTRKLTGWRRLEEPTRRWSGGWLAVHRGGPAGRGGARRARERALRWHGLEELRPGLHLRPDNLRGGADALRASLAAFGLEPGALVARLGDLGPASDAEARALWDGAALERGYRASLAELAESEQRLDQVDEARAMAESFLLGGRIIGQLVLDPLLPEPLVDPEPRRALVTAMRRYDRRGRRLWAAFMERHGAPHAEAPIHTGGGAPLPVLA